MARLLALVAGLCLVLVMAGTSAFSEERVIAPAEPIPSCGIASTLSWLMANGQSATLQDVETQFASQSPDFVPSAVSIAEVKQCLEHFGQTVDAISMTSTDPVHVSTPAILYFRPGRWPRAVSETVGHFVTLVRIEGSEAVILDWTGTSLYPLIRVPRTEIERLWDGEAVTAAGSRSSVPLIPLLVIGLGLMLVVWRRRAPKSCQVETSSAAGAASASVIVLLLVVAGCGGSNASTPDLRPVLTFETPMFDAGEVSAGKLVEHEKEPEAPPEDLD